MKLIEPGKDNNLLIFGSLACINAVPIIKELKSKSKRNHLSYITFADAKTSGHIVVSTVNESLEVFNSNMATAALFENLNKELLNLITEQKHSFDINCKITVLFNTYLDIDADAQNRILTADYSRGTDISRFTYRVAKRAVKDLEVFTFNDVYAFDDFVTRMTNSKALTLGDLLNLTKFYARFSP